MRGQGAYAALVYLNLVLFLVTLFRHGKSFSNDIKKR